MVTGKGITGIPEPKSLWPGGCQKLRDLPTLEQGLTGSMLHISILNIWDSVSKMRENPTNVWFPVGFSMKPTPKNRTHHI